MNDWTPPWLLTDEEYATPVRRGNRWTHYGLEYARDWWLRVAILVGPWAVLVVCWLSFRR